jgi:hypothetical protein
MPRPYTRGRIPFTKGAGFHTQNVYGEETLTPEQIQNTKLQLQNVLSICIFILVSDGGTHDESKKCSSTARRAATKGKI